VEADSVVALEVVECTRRSMIRCLEAEVEDKVDLTRKLLRVRGTIQQDQVMDLKGVAWVDHQIHLVVLETMISSRE
jgi:hypothetical protein